MIADLKLKIYGPPILFGLVYILAFGLYYILINDYEFLWYVLVLLFFFGLLISTIKQTKLSLLAVWGLALWGLLHMAGGGISVDGGVLYGYQIIPLIDKGGEFFILKFDQVVHFFGFGVATLIMWEIIKPRFTGSLGLLTFVVVLTGLGLGALNEMVEFLAVLVFASTGVGGYFNTGLDLVFNALGVLVVSLFLYSQTKFKSK